MLTIKQENLYSRRDLEKAYDMGLEMAIAMLEKSIGLSVAGQRYMLERLKEMIIEGKVNDVMK